MPLLVELPPDVETRLRQEAAQRGTEAETLVRDMVLRRVRRSSPKVTLSASEAELLQTLNAELTPDFWMRYKSLQERLQDNPITETEQSEFTAMTERTEEWNVRRLTLLETMAQRRGMHFPELMRALNIQHHPNAGSA